MRFFPNKTESFEVNLSRYEVLEIIQASFSPEGPGPKFNGKIDEETFQISLVLKRPNNFVPIISGMVEPEEKGTSMILVKYELFDSSKKFLAFWTVLTLLITLFFAIPYQAYLYAAISLAAGFVNYVITYENFKIQVRKSKRALFTLLGKS